MHYAAIQQDVLNFAVLLANSAAEYSSITVTCSLILKHLFIFENMHSNEFFQQENKLKKDLGFLIEFVCDNPNRSLV